MNEMILSKERRCASRPKAPKPCARLCLLLWGNKTTSKIFETKTGFMIYTLLCLASTGIIVWGLYYRLPLIDESSRLVSHKLSLQTQLAELKNRWPEEALSTLEERLTQEQSRIFDSYLALAVWLRNKYQYARQIGFDMKYEMQAHQLTRLPGVYSVPLTMRLTIPPEFSDKAYSGALEFMRSLVDENRHIEITGTSFNGDGGAIHSVELSLLTWVRDIEGIAQMNLAEKSQEDADAPFVE